MTERMQQVKRQRQSIVTVQAFDPRDVEYEVLLLNENTDHGEETATLSSLFSSSKTKMKPQSSALSDALKSLNAADSVQTAWEREMKRSRMMRKIHEQDCILSDVETSYEQFEKELSELEEYRQDVIYESIYMELFLLALYEEFSILKECEVTENVLEEKVESQLKERSGTIGKIQTTNVKIAGRDETIRKLQAKIKNLATQYTNATSESKFRKFLQKIFKKKYTAAKKRDDSDESFTLSSEASSDESGSDDSSEIGEVLFDENICPAGCDRELYDMAFSMREDRYALEQEIREEQKEIETLRKKMEMDSKHLRIVESNLKSSNEALKAFMLEKQRRLNDIDVVVVLKFHQLQHISDSDGTPEIRNCIVFNKKELSNLYTRIGELQEETRELEEKHKKNKTHLRRLKVDCKYMEVENKKLEEEIKEEMIKKFGRKVSLTDLFENVLQRMIHDAKVDIHKTVKNFDNEIKNIKQNCDEGLLLLENLIRDNTEKLSLLTVLEKEKAKLKKILDQVPISEVKLLIN